MTCILLSYDMRSQVLWKAVERVIPDIHKHT
jgi:hypothetical protein